MGVLQNGATVVPTESGSSAPPEPGAAGPARLRGGRPQSGHHCLGPSARSDARLSLLLLLLLLVVVVVVLPFSFVIYFFSGEQHVSDTIIFVSCPQINQHFRTVPSLLLASVLVFVFLVLFIFRGLQQCKFCCYNTTDCKDPPQPDVDRFIHHSGAAPQVIDDDSELHENYFEGLTYHYLKAAFCRVKHCGDGHKPAPL